MIGIREHKGAGEIAGRCPSGKNYVGVDVAADGDFESAVPRIESLAESRIHTRRDQVQRPCRQVIVARHTPEGGHRVAGCFLQKARCADIERPAGRHLVYGDPARRADIARLDG